MKSKLFANGAKMALSALVVCASLTSCYDLDGGSALIIPEPTPETVSYVLTGKVTDAMSYQPISGATVKFAAGEVKTDAKGVYETPAHSGISTKVLNVEMVTTGHDDHDHDHEADHDHDHDHDGGNGSGGGTGVGD